LQLKPDPLGGEALVVSQFEYVAIPVSLIITFGIARLLNGFPHVLSSQRTYWVHTLWCVTAIINLLLHWWAFWNASSSESWTLASYLGALTYPGLCYVGAAILVPTDPSAQTDWHAYFYSVRKLIFAVAGIATFANSVIAVVAGAFPLVSLGSLVTVGFVDLYIVGFSTPNERSQQVIVLVNAVLVVAVYAPLIYTPLGP